MPAEGFRVGDQEMSGMGCVEDWEGFGVDRFAGEEEGCVMRAFFGGIGEDGVLRG